jgi:membrane protein DedA with SNARE-associated domain
MNEAELIRLWQKSRQQIIIAQLAPTFLLITTAGLVEQVRDAGQLTVWAVIGILLASGILGALVEYTAAHEAQAVAKDLGSLNTKSTLAETIVKTAPWMHVVKYLTPAIFVGIFIALFVALTR